MRLERFCDARIRNTMQTPGGRKRVSGMSYGVGWDGMGWGRVGWDRVGVSGLVDQSDQAACHKVVCKKGWGRVGWGRVWVSGPDGQKRASRMS